MNTSPITQTIKQAFSAIIAALGRAVGDRRNTRTKWGDPIQPLPTPLIVAVYARLVNLNRRFQAVMDQIQAGTLPKPRVLRPEEAARRKARRAAKDPPTPRKPPHRELPVAYGPMAPLPRDFGYVLRLVPWHARPLADQMRGLLARPEMAQIIAETPRLQRLLRPLCHMLGIKPEGLIPPPPPPAGADEASAPPEGPAPAEAGSAWDARPERAVVVEGGAAPRGGGVPIGGWLETA